MFNIIGTAVCLTLFVLADALFSPAILGESASYLGIAICHTVFNVICTTLMLPAAGLLEKLVCRIVPDGKQPEAVCELDERLLTTPSIPAGCRRRSPELHAGACAGCAGGGEQNRPL